MQALRTRFDAALGAVLSVHRDALKGTRFDREANVARRTALCEEAEAILKGAGRQAEMASSGASLAALLKESLAANTIGGRVNEETKLRAAADRLRRAQSAWRDAGPVPGEEGRTLDARFQRANRRFFDLHPELRHHGPSAGHHGPPPQGHGRPGPPHRDRHPRPPRPPDGRKA
jgi:hypothetical protein